jgi:CRP/FNR family transcriptional regulator, dissimilatory nitrate respiration regulator
VVSASSLEPFELLRSLGQPAREALAARAVLRKYRAGQYLWRAGDTSHGLHLVVAGRVRILRDEGRAQHVVHVEGAGASLGEVPLFAGGGYPASAMAAEATTCVVIDRASLQAVMATHATLAWSLLGSLATRVRDLVERLSSRTGDPIQTRLASYILSQPRTTSGAVLLRETQQAIAEELGTVREIVGRQLAALVQAGLLERRGRGRYAVVDEAGLSTIARRAHI